MIKRVGREMRERDDERERERRDRTGVAGTCDSCRSCLLGLLLECRTLQPRSSVSRSDVEGISAKEVCMELCPWGIFLKMQGGERE